MLRCSLHLSVFHGIGVQYRPPGNLVISFAKESNRSVDSTASGPSKFAKFSNLQNKERSKLIALCSSLSNSSFPFLLIRLYFFEKDVPVSARFRRLDVSASVTEYFSESFGYTLDGFEHVVVKDVTAC